MADASGDAGVRYEPDERPLIALRRHLVSGTRTVPQTIRVGRIGSGHGRLRAFIGIWVAALKEGSLGLAKPAMGYLDRP